MLDCLLKYGFMLIKHKNKSTWA